MYWKIENTKEATNNMFGDLKQEAKYKWSISKLKWQEYATSEFREAIKELAANLCLRLGGFKELTRNLMLICLEVKQHVSKFHWCIKRAECQRKGVPELLTSKIGAKGVPELLTSKIGANS